MKEKEMMDWIDSASYKQLLLHCCDAPVGDPFFVGEIGDHYKKRMVEKSAAIDAAECVRASKEIDWRD